MPEQVRCLCQFVMSVVRESDCILKQVESIKESAHAFEDDQNIDRCECAKSELCV